MAQRDIYIIQRQSVGHQAMFLRVFIWCFFWCCCCLVANSMSMAICDMDYSHFFFAQNGNKNISVKTVALWHLVFLPQAICNDIDVIAVTSFGLDPSHCYYYNVILFFILHCCFSATELCADYNKKQVVVNESYPQVMRRFSHYFDTFCNLSCKLAFAFFIDFHNDFDMNNYTRDLNKIANKLLSSAFRQIRFVNTANEYSLL